MGCARGLQLKPRYAGLTILFRTVTGRPRVHVQAGVGYVIGVGRGGVVGIALREVRGRQRWGDLVSLIHVSIR
jgi:hypothetical protein